MQTIKTNHYSMEDLTILRSKIAACSNTNRKKMVLIELLNPKYDKYYQNEIILNIEKSKYRTELNKLIKEINKLDISNNP